MYTIIILKENLFAFNNVTYFIEKLILLEERKVSIISFELKINKFGLSPVFQLIFINF